MTTQPPSATQVARARREGRGALSEVAVFAAAGGAVLAALPALAVALQRAVREALAAAGRPDVDPWRAASAVAAGVVPSLGAALAAAVVAATLATLAQTRGARRAAEPTGRSGEPGAWASAVTGAVYGGAALVAGAVEWASARSLAGVAWRLAAAAAALGVADVAWRAWCWRRALRTTAAERRQAQREDEGDPAVKRERARRMR